MTVLTRGIDVHGKFVLPWPGGGAGSCLSTAGSSRYTYAEQLPHPAVNFSTVNALQVLALLSWHRSSSKRNS